MNAKFSRRLIAYLIDFAFIAAILMILANFIPKSADFDFLNQDMNALTEQAMNNEITFESYLREYTNYLREIDKVNVLYNSISLIIIIIYYSIIPIYTSCTLGKYIMKLRIERKDKKKLNFYNLILRSIIDQGLLLSLITIIMAQLVSNKTYLITIFILGIIQILLVIISGFMILYRRDARGLQDIISNSKIVKKEV